MNVKKINQYMDNLKHSDAPLADLVVCYKGEKVYDYTFGFMDDNKTPITSDNSYYLYSTTKVITCTAFLRLVEQDLIKLDDPVYKYIPEFKEVSVKTKGNIAKNIMTIRHLMSMTSGLSYDMSAPHIKQAIENKSNSTLDVVRELAKDPLLFEPGTGYMYGFGHDVLAAIIEVVTGLKFSDYISENIFKPLGMNSSTYKVTDDVLKNMCPEYWFNPDDNSFNKSDLSNIFILTPNYESGGAGLISTVNDYIKFATVMANGGTSANGYHLLSRDLIDQMRTPQLNDKCLSEFWKSSGGYSYGLGVRTLIDKSKSKGPVGEFGWDGAACSYVLIDVENNLTIFYATHVTNWNPGYQIHIDIRDLVYESLELDK